MKKDDAKIEEIEQKKRVLLIGDKDGFRKLAMLLENHSRSKQLIVSI
jgi:hypothetical protein